MIVHLSPGRPGRRNSFVHHRRRDSEGAPRGDIAAISKHRLDRERASLPPQANAREGIEEGLWTDSISGAGPGHDRMQNGIVEGEGDVGCVEGDESSDEVRIRVGLDVQDLAEDTEGCIGYVLRI